MMYAYTHIHTYIHYVGSAVASGVNFLTTLVAIRCIDHAGRKTMLCGGTYGMYVCMYGHTNCAQEIYMYVCVKTISYVVHVYVYV